MVISTPNEWIETAVADNVAAVATRAGVAGEAHYITHLSGSFGVANVGKRLDLKDGAAIIMTWFVQEDVAIDFAHPIEITPGNDAVLSLAASGAGGDLGSVNLAGFTAVKS